MRLYNFSWKKYKIGDDIVEAKRIMLYAAKRSATENEIFLDIGYYWRLPSCQEFPKLNNATVLHEKPAVFFKEGQLPLTVLLEKVSPIWTYNEEETAQIINFSTVSITEESFCTFVLNKMTSDETDGCACFFKAGQGSNLVKLLFSLKESSLSRAEAIIPSTRNGTADSQEKLPSAISHTKVRNKFLQDLSENIGKCWMDVGRKLQLTEEQLENLEQKSYPNLKETTYQMLLVWKRKRASAATYDVLADALRKAGRVDLQEELLEKYKPS
ncbi:uncharacterized protein [Apostichopus japonicus]|uniref:uncharacterized protein n=1 Tax=Stichopus japonicus TaxID=307972 RepID=UPI003AB37FB2